MKIIDKRIGSAFLAVTVFCLCGSAVAKDAIISVRMDDIMQVRPVSLIGSNTKDLNYQLYGGLYNNADDSDGPVDRIKIARQSR